MAVADRPNITEAFFMEWVAFGLAELAAYLAKCAGFDDWCNEHDRL